MRWRVGTALAAGAIGCVALSAPALAAPGDLDPEFSGDGTTRIDIAGAADSSRAMSLQPDGKIVLGGFAQVGPGEGDVAAARLLPDGSPDADFGSAGKALIDFGTVSEGAWGLDIDPAGRVLLAGSAGADSFSLARLTPGGQPDDTLGGDGTVVGDFGGAGSAAREVLAHPDGRITVAGHNRTGADYDFAAARLDQSGAYDSSFDDDGKVTMDLGTTFDVGSDAALLTGGDLLIAGVTGAPGYDCGLARFTGFGAPAAGFGSAGFVLRDVGGHDYCDSLALTRAGQILVSGRTEAPQSELMVARLTPDGAFDPGFGGGGYFVGSIPGFDSTPAVAESPDGKVVVGGSLPGETDAFMVLRFNPDGSLDPTFSGDGIATADFGLDAYISELAVQPDGDVVAAGSLLTDDSIAVDMAVARFEGGPLGLEVEAKRKQGAGKLRARVLCSLPCQVRARGKGKGGGEKFKTKRAAADVGAQETAKLRLRLKPRLRRELKGEKGKVRVRVVANSGELTAAARTKIKLKR